MKVIIILCTIFAFYCSNIFAYDVCIDGIYYNLDDTYSIATVTYEKKEDSGNYENFPDKRLEIPYVVYYQDKMYIVMYIDEYAFAYNQTIEEIRIGANVRTIGDYAFYKCSQLRQINIPQQVTSLPGHTFYRCSNLKNLIIDESEDLLNLNYRRIYSTTKKYTYYGTFEDCVLDSVIINRPITYSLPKENSVIGWYEGAPFGRSETLRSVTLGKNVTNIGKYLFYECSNLQIVNIFGNVTTIDDYAFSNCSSIRRLVLPASINKIGIQAIRDVSAKPLVFLSKNITFGQNALWRTGGSVIYAYASEHEKIIDAKFSNIKNLYDIENPFKIEAQPSLKSVRFTVDFGDYFNVDNAQITKVYTSDGTELKPDNDGFYNLSDLEIGKSYEIYIAYILNGKEMTGHMSVSTVIPKVDLTLKSHTQTTLTVHCPASRDETVYEERGVYFNGIYYKADANGNVTLDNLDPNTTYSIKSYAFYGKDKYFFSDNKEFTTDAILLKLEGITSSTSVNCQGIISAGDATIESFGFDNENVQGDNLQLTNLDPETEYTITFFVRTNNGYTTSAVSTFKTEPLILSTPNVKAVSNSCAIVSTITNIDENETNVGFQWRKYDAPASLPSNEGYGAIYNGQIEGYIKNLQSAFYYNVRAFYKSRTNNYYYGDWVTFDPSDYSYFEPIIHTYSEPEVASNSAQIKGYVLRGTDEIIEQGFEYWIMNKGDNLTWHGTPQTVTAKGQKMSAWIYNLAENSTYVYRAYAKTDKCTVYGEEMQFDTPLLSGIENIPTTMNNDIDIEVIQGCNQNIRIRILNENGHFDFRIINVNGSVLLHGTIDASGEWNSVAMTGKKGIYFLQIIGKSKSKTLKLLVK